MTPFDEDPVDDVLPGNFIVGRFALLFIPFVLALVELSEFEALLSVVPFEVILARLSPAAGPRRLAMPPAGILRPGIPPAPGAGDDRELRAIGPDEPTRPTAPPDMGIGDGLPGPLCPTSCGLPFAVEGEEEEEVPFTEGWRRKADVGMRSDAPI